MANYFRYVEIDDIPVKIDILRRDLFQDLYHQKTGRQ